MQHYWQSRRLSSQTWTWEGAETELKSSEEDLSLTVTAAGAKWRIRQHQTGKWQESWDRGQTGRLLHNIIPRGNSRTHTHQLPRSVETHINRLWSGFSKLKEHLYLHGKLVDSPECECGQEAETTRHYLLDCANYNEEHTIMIDTIERLYVENDIPPGYRSLDVVTLLGGNQDLPPQINCNIIQAVGDYIRATRQGVWCCNTDSFSTQDITLS